MPAELNGDRSAVLNDFPHFLGVICMQPEFDGDMRLIFASVVG
jgi:hypothetical protein